MLVPERLRGVLAVPLALGGLLAGADAAAAAAARPRHRGRDAGTAPALPDITVPDGVEPPGRPGATATRPATRTNGPGRPAAVQRASRRSPSRATTRPATRRTKTTDGPATSPAPTNVRVQGNVFGDNEAGDQTNRSTTSESGTGVAVAGVGAQVDADQLDRADPGTGRQHARRPDEHQPRHRAVHGQRRTASSSATAEAVKNPLNTSSQETCSATTRPATSERQRRRRGVGEQREGRRLRSRAARPPTRRRSRGDADRRATRTSSSPRPATTRAGDQANTQHRRSRTPKRRGEQRPARRPSAARAIRRPTQTATTRSTPNADATARRHAAATATCSRPRTGDNTVGDADQREHRRRAVLVHVGDHAAARRRRTGTGQQTRRPARHDALAADRRRHRRCRTCPENSNVQPNRTGDNRAGDQANANTSRDATPRARRQTTQISRAERRPADRPDGQTTSRAPWPRPTRPDRRGQHQRPDTTTRRQPHRRPDGREPARRIVRQPGGHDSQAPTRSAAASRAIVQDAATDSASTDRAPTTRRVRLRSARNNGPHAEQPGGDNRAGDQTQVDRADADSSSRARHRPAGGAAPGLDGGRPVDHPERGHHLGGGAAATATTVRELPAIEQANVAGDNRAGDQTACPGRRRRRQQAATRQSAKQQRAKGAGDQSIVQDGTTGAGSTATGTAAQQVADQPGRSADGHGANRTGDQANVAAADAERGRHRDHGPAGSAAAPRGRARRPSRRTPTTAAPSPSRPPTRPPR